MIANVLSILFSLLGGFFLLVGSLGLIRLPDFYSRNHATGKSDTLGIMLVLLGFIFYEGLSLNSAKILLILIFVFLTNPTATHALTNAAYYSGLMPYFTGDKKEEEKCTSP